MATLIDLAGMHEDYPSVVQRVLRDGYVTKPRDQETRELTDVTLVLHDPYDALPVGTGRGLKLEIGAAEALQLIGGFSDPDLMLATSANFGRYMEYGRFHGAYGQRIGGQVYHVIRKLYDDRDSRQAVITLWSPTLDNDPGHLDYPCTIALGFRIRRDRLELTTTMRSNDVWLGLPYDVFQFTQLQITVAQCMGLDVGPYTHTAWSFHLYEQHYAAAEELHPGTKGPLIIDGIGGDKSFSEAYKRARFIALYGGRASDHLPDVTGGEIWYAKQIAKVRA